LTPALEKGSRVLDHNLDTQRVEAEVPARGRDHLAVAIDRNDTGIGHECSGHASDRSAAEAEQQNRARGFRQRHERCAEGLPNGMGGGAARADRRHERTVDAQLARAAVLDDANPRLQASFRSTKHFR
jgi:hypothetical protein